MNVLSCVALLQCINAQLLICHIHNSISAVHEDGTSQHNHSVEDKFHELDKRFRDLSFEAQTEFGQTTTRLSRFRDKLTSLPLGIKKEHTGFLQLERNAIFEANSVEEIFMKSLSPYWSFLDFNLLDYLVRELGSIELQTKMGAYRNDLTQFKRTATVSQLAPLWSSVIEDPPKACRLKMIQSENSSEITLEQLDMLRRKFCSVVLLSDLTMIVADVGDGSVRVIWLLPASAASLVTAAVRGYIGSFFKEYGIQRIELDGVLLFPEGKLCNIHICGGGS